MNQLVTESCHILIFGANGDLAKRKLYPSLYRLFAQQYLAADTAIIGVSRQDFSRESFLEEIKDHVIRHIDPREFSEDTWRVFASRLFYSAIDIRACTGFDTLKTLIKETVSAPLLVYLATDPCFFGAICKKLQLAGIVDQHTRVILEKPIGEDLHSSRVINDQVAEVFSEERTYRIDHYLGKETVQNLLAIRFANALFEPLWNASSIDHVQITVAETVGVEGRWAYYNRAGALRDMVQNHMLQLVCLVAMEPPGSLEADAVRDEKLKVVRALKRIRPDEVTEHCVRGQYASGLLGGQPVPDYQAEGDGSYSLTESFVALRLELDSWRWAGVPFYLRTGKRLPLRYSEIVIQFRQVPHSIFSSGQQDSLVANRLVIRLQPEESIQLVMMNKVPGLDGNMRLRAVPLNLSLSEAFDSPRPPMAHERLMLDVIRQNQTLFMRRDEVEAAWCWIDGIQKGWAQLGGSPELYAAGTWGPRSAFQMMMRDGRRWHD